MVEREALPSAVRPDIDPLDSETIARVMDPMRGTEVIVRKLLVPFVATAFAIWPKLCLTRTWSSAIL
jgi:hypothetical protein